MDDDNTVPVDKTYFFSNCCHVCRKYGIQLTSCTTCQMISYCNEDHQKQHLPQHKEICAAIKHVLGDKKYMNTKEISSDKWAGIRIKYLTRVSEELRRDLQNEETQMFLFTKACVVCHRQDGVIGCSDCPNAAFCDKHREDSEHREKYCKLMQETVKINECCAATMRFDISYVRNLSDKMLLPNIEVYLDTYVPLDKYNVYSRMLHSNGVTNPLTVYFCAKMLDHIRCKALNIHIIYPGKSYQEETNIWLILLMLFPTLTTLTITFIKPKRPFSKCDRITCPINLSETKKLVANVCYMEYEKYVGSEDYEKPDFIVGFHADTISDNDAQNKYVDISEQSGKALAEQKCPCILIFDDLHQTHIDILNILYQNNVDKDMPNIIKRNLFAKNPFMNLMPHRRFITEGVIYPNNYLIIIDNLDSSKVLINSKNQCFLFLNTIQK